MVRAALFAVVPALLLLAVPLCAAVPKMGDHYTLADLEHLEGQRVPLPKAGCSIELPAGGWVWFRYKRSDTINGSRKPLSSNGKVTGGVGVSISSENNNLPVTEDFLKFYVNGHRSLYKGTVYKYTSRTADTLRAFRAPEAVVDKLDVLMDREFETKELFVAELAKLLDKDELARFRDCVLGCNRSMGKMENDKVEMLDSPAAKQCGRLSYEVVDPNGKRHYTVTYFANTAANSRLVIEGHAGNAGDLDAIKTVFDSVKPLNPPAATDKK